MQASLELVFGEDFARFGAEIVVVKSKTKVSFSCIMGRMATDISLYFLGGWVRWGRRFLSILECKILLKYIVTRKVNRL